MNVLVVKFVVAGDKMWVYSDFDLKNIEFYLPDSTEKSLHEFMTEAVADVAKQLAIERPWRNTVES